MANLGSEAAVCARVPDARAEDIKFSNLYSTTPDFKNLAQLDPEFAKIWPERKADFFNDPKCVMQLTKTLLKVDFDLNIKLLDDRLCPPVGVSDIFGPKLAWLTYPKVTNRHNYILWLKGLLDTTSYDEPGRKITGLDIGTGASCIYPLLGCAQRPWSFIATDIDAESLESAKRNVQLNNLEARIKVVTRNPDDSLIPLDDLSIENIDFIMTNPPFYKSTEEMVQSAAQKSRPPFTACTGANVEMVTPGGEVSFVDRILQESLTLRQRVQWYTSMFGFFSSLIDFVEKLRDHGIDNYAVTEFVQGSKTKRWAVAWSFGAMRPALEVSRGMKAPASKNILPAITEVEIIKFPVPEKIGAFADSLATAISNLELISWSWNPQRLEGTGHAVDKVWGRAWRRWKKREMDMKQDEEKPESSGEPKCALGFKVHVRVGTEQVSVGCRWMEGHDAVLFESFQGFLKATVQGILSSKAGISPIYHKSHS
ncbi:Fc.00g084850.m01.CDS01 [Cosmosporella sp. VM-42]